MFSEYEESRSTLYDRVEINRIVWNELPINICCTYFTHFTQRELLLWKHTMYIRVVELQHRLRKWKRYFVSLLDLKDLNTHFPNASSNYFDDNNLYNFWGKQGAVYTNTTFRGLEKKKQKEENSGLIVITLLYERKNHTIPVSSVTSVMHLTNLRTFSFLAFNERLEIPNLFYHG